MASGKWKKTLFSDLQEAQRVASQMNLRPSDIIFDEEHKISYFTTTKGIVVARKGNGPVMEKVPSKRSRQNKYRSYYRKVSTMEVYEPRKALRASPVLRYPEYTSLEDVRQRYLTEFRPGEFIVEPAIIVLGKDSKHIFYTEEGGGIRGFSLTEPAYEDPLLEEGGIKWEEYLKRHKLLDEYRATKNKTSS